MYSFLFSHTFSTLSLQFSSSLLSTPRHIPSQWRWEIPPSEYFVQLNNLKYESTTFAICSSFFVVSFIKLHTKHYSSVEKQCCNKNSEIVSNSLQFFFRFFFMWCSWFWQLLCIYLLTVVRGTFPPPEYFLELKNLKDESAGVSICNSFYCCFFYKILYRKLLEREKECCIKNSSLIFSNFFKILFEPFQILSK